jgi:hypothetical protein
MDLTQLQAMGAIVPTKPIKREVKIKRPELRPETEWADPNVPEFTGEIVDDTMTVYIRKGMAVDSLEMLSEEGGRRAAMAIHLSVCHADGTKVFPTMEHVIGNGKDPGEEGYLGALAEWIFYPLMIELSQVEKETRPKYSRRRKNGGSKPVSPTASRKPN